MSIKIMSEVWEEAPARGGALLFLLALADQAGDSDRCSWPGVEQLMHRARCSERSAYEYAAELVRAGVLVRLEGVDRPVRYSKKAGRETTCWYITAPSEWRGADFAPLRATAGNPCEPPQVTPASHRTRTKDQTKEDCHLNPVAFSDGERAPRQEPSGKTQRVRGSFGQRQVDEERAPSASVMDDGVDTPAEDEDQPPSNLRKLHRGLSANSLAHGFALRALEVDLPLEVRTTAISGLRNKITTWKNDGFTFQQIQDAMNLYFLAPESHQRPGIPMWLCFINSFTALRERITEPDITSIDYYTEHREQKTWSSFEEYEAEMLAEAMREA